MRLQGLLAAAWLAATLMMTGCGQEKIHVASVKFINIDRGSGLFDRAIQICFDKPVESKYWHHIVFMSKDGVKFEGEGWIRPLATAKNPRCQDKVIYMYIDKNSPPDSRTLVHDHIKQGNIAQLLIQIYPDKPEDPKRAVPMDEKLFTNL
ncbi:hypothetical protein [Sulfurivirga sp.]|uniref:hypothetical protein n=1 Tax=Sulfurivirga sp. TaxID=2614236 RepID=UPI0025D0FD0F|nr:hypothetical protein [Sulfurivirga sp.]